MIRITSKQEGFRRAGMSHTKEPKEYPDHQFSPEQLAALEAEPMLTVEIVPDRKEKTEDSPVAHATEKAEADKTGKESAKIRKKGKR